MRADVHRFGLIDPGDVSGLRNAIERASVNPKEIVAVIGKTHGNGLVNDYKYPVHPRATVRDRTT